MAQVCSFPAAMLATGPVVPVTATGTLERSSGPVSPVPNCPADPSLQQNARPLAVAAQAWPYPVEIEAFSAPLIHKSIGFEYSY